MFATTRFFTGYVRPGWIDVVEETTGYHRGSELLEATVLRPARARRPLPGWVLLHGLTFRGREHPTLRRFARALSASGTVVMIPDIPEWRDLDIAPRSTVATIQSAVLDLDAMGVTAPGRIGVIGFSFGATQALVASTDARLEGHLGGIAAWGGYHSIRRLVTFVFLGEHELDGRPYRAEPDPYGRWVMAGNFLRLAPGYEDRTDVTRALLDLAREAGRLMIPSGHKALDPEIARARESVEPEAREVFDLFARPSGTTLTDTQRSHLRDIVERTAPRVVEAEPLLEPGPFLPSIRVPVVLAHGREDRLIPWTETLRLQREIPAARLSHAAVTRLFAHSFRDRKFPGPRFFFEVYRFRRLLRRILRLI